MTRTVKVNGESAVNGVKCIAERMSPRPRTVTYIGMVLNIIYLGNKFDLKFRVLNWFWTWTEPTEPVLLGSVQVWVQVWADDSRFRFRLRRPWTGLNWTTTALYYCYGTRLWTYPFHFPFNTVNRWFTVYFHRSCHLLCQHFSLHSLVVNFLLWFFLAPNGCLSPKPMTHRFVPLAYSAFHCLPECSIPWSMHRLGSYKYRAVLYY